MNCETFLSDLYPYADGELGDSPAAKAVARHVSACPSCADQVREHGEIRRILRRAYESRPTPPTLEGKIRQAMTAESAPTILRETLPRRPADRRFFAFRPMAMAASVLLAAAGFWYALQPNSASSTAAFPTALAERVAAKHHICCERHEAHHLAGIPRDCPHAAKAIEEHFLSQGSSLMAAAPDLTRHGFAFESVNFCGIRGPGCVSGGHILYVNATGDRRLSVFSIPAPLVPNRHELDQYDHITSPVPACRPVITQVADRGHPACVAMWHQGDSYYFCCGEISDDQMRLLVEEVRIAAERPATQDMFARISRNVVP